MNPDWQAVVARMVRKQSAREAQPRAVPGGLALWAGSGLDRGDARDCFSVVARDHHHFSTFIRVSGAGLRAQ